MSDDRWIEIEKDVAAAVRHFRLGIEKYENDVLAGSDPAAYYAQMAFMHAMQSGHTLLESAIVRILKLLRERRPDGEHWHSDLLDRAALSRENRPPILTPELARAAQRTRAFRHVAMRAYDTFDPELAAPAVRAARLVAAELAGSIAAFRAAVDG